MTGVIYYGGAGWWVDLTLTGLDPDEALHLRHQRLARQGQYRWTPGYDDRITMYTLSGADASTNSSTSGVTVISPTSVSFSTGNNHAEGYVARWTDIDPGADGTIVIRAESDPTAGWRRAQGLRLRRVPARGAGHGGMRRQYRGPRRGLRRRQHRPRRLLLGHLPVRVVRDRVPRGGGRLRRGRDVRRRGACPADGFEPPGTACGDPGDTVCDDPDTCDAAGSCQANYEPPATLCRSVGRRMRCLRSTATGPALPVRRMRSPRPSAGLRYTSATRPSSPRRESVAVRWIGPRTVRPDGDLCNGDEICAGFVCTAGYPLTCDDDQSSPPTAAKRPWAAYSSRSRAWATGGPTFPALRRSAGCC